MSRPPTSPPVPRLSLADLVFMLVFGTAGWVALALAAYADVAPAPAGAGPLAFGLFLAVVVLGRSMAFELMPRTVVSADAAFYVAAAVCLGPLAAGWLVAVALTVDSLTRLRRVGRAEAGAPRGRVRSVAYVIYFGGMTGALLFGLGWALDAASLLALRGQHAELVGRVLALGGALLVAHYAIQGMRQFLAGRELRVYLRQMALPGMLAEVSLMPLAVVVVLVYQPAEPLGFALLGATYLLINFVFNRLVRTRDALRQRVSELETLNATASGLSQTLETRQLVESAAREIAYAIPVVDRIELSLIASEGGYVTDAYRPAAGELVRSHAGDVGPELGWVIEHGQALAIPPVGVDAATASLPGRQGGSWMGVPVWMYGGVEGVLSIESAQPGAFGADQLRLLEAIAAQLAVALQNAHLYELAMVDGLTGLFVRRYFDARLDEEIKRAQRFGTVFSVVMMDIDDFKELNDTHGHVVGDRALRAIADVVRRQMRGVDTAARYGGEEIAVILPRTELVDAYNQAERIRAEIEALELVEEGPLGVTASFGIAAYPDSGASDSVDLVRCADRALYRAKKTGKNRVELYWNDGDESPGKSSLRTA